MLESSLRVHLSILKMSEAALGVDLMQLHARCPQLEELAIYVNGPSVAALMDSAEDASMFNAHAWPSSLRSLEILMREANSIGLQPLLNALPSSVIGLQSLTLSMQRADALDLTPLLGLPHLTRLTALRLSSPQLFVVRQLRSLTELDVKGARWFRKDLCALLLDAPHQLQRLQRINLKGFDLDSATMPTLLTLPSLTELEPRSIDPRCFPLLRSLTKLRKLCVPFIRSEMEQSAAEVLVSSVRALSCLTSFDMNGWGLNSAVLTALVAGLCSAAPLLCELTLRDVSSLDALNELRTCVQLRALVLDRCWSGSGTDSAVADLLPLLQSLPYLESLHVFHCTHVLTDEQRAQLTPPSSLMPSLKQFEWN
jgi:hypothetical protein